MKKIVSTLLAIGFLAFAGVASAQVDLGSSLTQEAAKKAGYAANTDETTLSEVLGTIVQAVLSFVGVIFLSLTVYAGILWMTARGDEGQVEKSKDILKTSIIGIIITLGAFSITRFILPAILERTVGG